MKSIFSLMALSLSFSCFAEIIIDENETELLTSFDPQSEIYRHSSPTGRLKMKGAFGIHDYCTISLISKNEVITAAHCFDADKNLSKMTAFFEYYDRSSKTKRPFNVLKVKMHDIEKDVTILELEGNPGEIYGTYPIARTQPQEGDALLVYQHPALDPKSISRINCRFLEQQGDRFFHSCDTENYSSGSPILNERFELVAIHRGAIITMTDARNYGAIIRE